MATNTLDTFYVILTKSPGSSPSLDFKTVGYYAVSFELRTVDGHVRGNHERAAGIYQDTTWISYYCICITLV